jgi:hypothetical protein
VVGVCCGQGTKEGGREVVCMGYRHAVGDDSVGGKERLGLMGAQRG